MTTQEQEDAIKSIDEAIILADSLCKLTSLMYEHYVIRDGGFHSRQDCEETVAIYEDAIAKLAEATKLDEFGDDYEIKYSYEVKLYFAGNKRVYGIGTGATYDAARLQAEQNFPCEISRGVREDITISAIIDGELARGIRYLDEVFELVEVEEGNSNGN